MPITKDADNVITYTARKPLNTAAGDDSGAIRATDFAICDTDDLTKQIKWDVSGVTTGTAVTMTVPDVSGTPAILDGTGELQNSADFIATGGITGDTITASTTVTALGSLNAVVADDQITITGTTIAQLPQAGEGNLAFPNTNVTALTLHAEDGFTGSFEAGTDTITVVDGIITDVSPT